MLPDRSTFYIETLGCRANQADSAILQRQLEECHYLMVSDPRSADVVVVNTCTVTHLADQDGRQAIRRLHRHNPGARLIVTGCYAQRAPAELSKIEGVGWVVPGSCREQIPDLVQIGEGEGSRQALQAIPFGGDDRTEVLPGAAPGRTRPFVKIQDGCDARCSYCIVPQVRGPARSAPPASVHEQIRQLIAEGNQEIVLTGIHLGSYGQHLKPRTSLARLVAEALEIPGLGQLRLSGIEPMRFSPALVELAMRNERLAPHFHLPLQSGSARTLAAMRRPYRPMQYLDQVADIKNRVPDAAIGADVMVGFPGETEQDHLESLHFVERSPITHVHVFSYSPRSGTVAAEQAPLDPAVVHRRSREFRSLARTKKARFEKHFIGRTMRGLVLKTAQQEGFRKVLTGNYLTVLVPSQEGLLPNTWVQVMIEAVGSGNLQGRLESEKPA